MNQEFFGKFWKVVESGDPLTVEIVRGASKVLWKEGGKYFLSAGGKKGSVSRRRARTEIHNMVARLLDEQRLQGKE
tara:strand:- start:1842 stop:2069 length:228 start_codon:yes stop_codon:yes gene_type:complete